MAFPPTYSAPPIPTPPVPGTTIAPVVVLVDAVVEAPTMLPLAIIVPLAVSVVNAPEPGVALPMATACNPPPVAVVNVVAPTKFVVLECVTAPVTPSVVPTVKLLVIVLA